jgi:hypothetical protein
MVGVEDEEELVDNSLHIASDGTFGNFTRN